MFGEFLRRRNIEVCQGNIKVKSAARKCIETFHWNNLMSFSINIRFPNAYD